MWEATLNSRAICKPNLLHPQPVSTRDNAYALVLRHQQKPPSSLALHLRRRRLSTEGSIRVTTRTEIDLCRPLESDSAPSGSVVYQP